MRLRLILVFVLGIVFLFNGVFVTGNFISTWDTTKISDGSTTDRDIKLPLVSNGDYNFTVYWGDGRSDHITAWNSIDRTHRYYHGGVYEITIEGKINGFSFGGDDDRTKILNITNWSGLLLGNNGNYFYLSENLVDIVGEVNLSGTTNFLHIFRDAVNFNGNISGWNVGSITNMEGAFRDARAFNQDLNDWNVSKVTDMENMFRGATAFNGSVSNWDVSGVTLMTTMFRDADDFNQDIGDWDVGKVTKMSGMFRDADDFNQDLTRWRVCRVTNRNNFDLDANAWDSANKPKFEHPCIVSVNSTNADGNHSFGDVVNVTIGFNEDVDVSDGEEIKLELEFDGVNRNATYVSAGSDENLRNLVFSYVVQRGDFSSDLDYSGAYSLSLGAGMINASDDGKDAVLTMPSRDTLARNKNIAVDGRVFTSTWNTSATSSGSSNNTSISLPLEEGGDYDFTVYWGDGNISKVTAWNSVNKTHDYGAGNGGVKVIDILGRLNGFRFNNEGDKEKLINITEWSDLNLGNNGSYFYGAVNFVNISANDVNFSGMTNFSEMFRGAGKFSGNISGWNVSGATDMRKMFRGATVFNADISGWDVSGVVDMADMFKDAVEFNADISGWDVSGVVDINGTFSGATVFNADISGWDVSGVVDMAGMFSSAVAFNQDIGGWDVGNVANMNFMFSGATAFNRDLGGWRVCEVVGSDGFDDNADAWESVNKPKWGHPCVVSVGSSDVDGVYFAGDVVGVDVEFDEVVVVSGVPVLEMEFENRRGNATYVSGNGTRNLTFNYSIRIGDYSSDLDYVGADSLRLDGATINASDDGVDAVLTMPSRNTLAVNRDVVITGDDIDDPLISDVVPANNSKVADNTPLIVFNVTEPSLDAVRLYVDGADVSDDLNNLGSVYNYTTDALSDGEHNFSIFVNDTFGNNITDVWVFEVDMTEPNVTDVVPANNSKVAVNTTTISFNVSDANLDFVWLYVDGVNVSGLTNVSEVYSYVVSDLGDGEHRFTIYANDTVDNNFNQTYVFEVDTVEPNITNVVPADGSLVGGMPMISFNVTDVNLDSVNISIDGGDNVTLTGSVVGVGTKRYNYTTDALSDGEHNFTIYAGDSVGNSFSGVWVFEVDMTKPNVTDVVPVNNSKVAVNTTTISFNVSDANLDFVWLFVDGVNVSGLTNVSEVYSYVVSDLGDGEHRFTIYANDTVDNNFNQTYVFEVDTVEPNITNVVPADGSLVGGMPMISFNVTDVNLDSVNISIDGGDNVTLTGSVVGVGTKRYNYTTDALSDGEHNFTIYAGDSVGNSFSGVWVFEVDMTKPNVTDVVPVNNSNLSDSTPNISFSVVDGNLDFVWLYVDGVNVSGLTNVSEDYRYVVSNLSDGEHSFTIYANDTVDNNFNQTYVFEVDTVEPNITNVVPADETGVSVENLMIGFNVSDVNLDGVSISFNGSNVTLVGVGNGTNKIYGYNVSGLNETKYNFTIYVNDSAGNSVSEFYEFVVDRTEPDVDIMGTSSDKTDTTPEIRFSVNDSNYNYGSGLSYEVFVGGVSKLSGGGTERDYSVVVPDLSVGSHTIKVSVSDVAGNIGNDSVSIEIEERKSSGGSSGGSGWGSGGGGSGGSGSSSGGGSGSRGSGVPKQNETGNVSDLVVSGKMVFNFTGSVVHSVEVVINKGVSDVGVVVRNVSGLPKYSDVVDDDMVYDLVEVDFDGFTHGDVGVVKFMFSVDKSWADERGLSRDDVVLHGLNSGGWQDLGGDFVNETGGKFVYSVVVNADYDAYAVIGVERVVEEKERSFVWFLVGGFVGIIVILAVVFFFVRKKLYGRNKEMMKESVLRKRGI